MNCAPEPRRRTLLGALGCLWLLGGCATRPPLSLAPLVDIDRFMGDWYVIACIPTLIERNTYGAVESYRRAPDGRILTTFTFRDGSFDGPQKSYHPVGFVVPGSSGAVWGMRFIWPIRADYRIMYLDESYTLTLIGRERRDYAWIMARTPVIADDQYSLMEEKLRAAGYDTSRLRRVPQLPLR
jgi:apolipoprotein D and lipocalin family protein